MPELKHSFETLIIGSVIAVFSFISTAHAAGDWKMIRSVIGVSGAVELSSGSMQLNQAVGESIASAQTLEWSSGTLLSGYLSQIPSDDITLSAETATSTETINIFGRSLGMPPLGAANFSFSSEIDDSVLVSGAVVAQEIFNHLGELSHSVWPVAVSFGDFGQTLRIQPAIPWPKGSLFALSVSTALRDINGMNLFSPSTFYFSIILDHAVENVARLVDDKTRIKIPPDAYEEDYAVAFTTSARSEAIQSAALKIQSSSGFVRAPLSVVTAEAYDKDKKALPSALNGEAVIIFPYKNESGNGYVDSVSPPVKAKNLSVWRMNEAQGRWIRQSNSSVDLAEREVSLVTKHFSTYALVPQLTTDVSDFYAYPVPFRPNAGNTARYGSWATGITFTGLPSEGSIRIFTIAGDLVRSIDVASSRNTDDEIPWDVKNSAGEVIASGVYIWEIISGDNRKTGKLMVIK